VKPTNGTACTKLMPFQAVARAMTRLAWCIAAKPLQAHTAPNVLVFQ